MMWWSRRTRRKYSKEVLDKVEEDHIKALEAHEKFWGDLTPLYQDFNRAMAYVRKEHQDESESTPKK